MAKTPKSKIQLSLVLPLFNEQAGVTALGKRLTKLAPKLPRQTEVIFVDDGSKDETVQELRKVKIPYSKVIIQLSRNFGHQAALLAGLEKSRGQYIVTLDGDLQHPPEFIPKMLAAHAKGVDIVLTKRLDGDITSPFKRLSAQLFYAAINAVSETPIQYSASDFRSMNRQALDTLLGLDERRKFLRGMVEWIGFSSIVLPFKVEARKYGYSKYSLLKMVQLGLHGVTAFSVVPLYLSAFCSIGLFVGAALYASYVLYIRIFTGSVVNGWASVLFVNLVIGGLTLLFLGLLGMYIAAIYIEVKKRPIYVTKATYEQQK